MNIYTPTGAVTQVSPTVWSFPTATGVKYFTPSIEGWNGTESELMPLRAGGGGQSTQIPWESADKGEMARFGGGRLGFAGENNPVSAGGPTNHAGWFFDTNPGQATYNYDEGGSFFGDVLGNFISGPGVPLGGFLGAGAMGSGGLGNFLGSFGGGGAAGAAGGAMDMGVGLSDVFGIGDVPGWGVNGGGKMFDPLADFSSSYFDTPDLGFDMSGLEGMSSYNSAGNLINLNPLQQIQSTLSGVPNGTANALKQAFGLATSGNGGSLLGAGLGGLLGLLGGSSKPAGTTTTVTDIPDWLKPYVMSNLNAATARSAQIGSATPLLGPGQDEMLKTIQGQYLTPDSNPYLKATVDDALGQAKSAFNSQYANIQGGGDNMMNSGYQEALARNLGKTALPFYNQNYQTERGRQLGAATAAPDYTTSQYGAAFSPFTSYSNLTRGLGSQSSQPYFTNPMAGALGGAALGSQFGKIFSGGGPFG